jgi:hypothetical protein
MWERDARRRYGATRWTSASLLLALFVVCATSKVEDKAERFVRCDFDVAAKILIVIFSCFSEELPPNTKYTVVTYHTARPASRKNFVTMTGKISGQVGHSQLQVQGMQL